MMSAEKISKRNKNQWRCVLTTFAPVRKLDENNVIASRKSLNNTKNFKLCKRTPFSQNSSRLNSSAISSEEDESADSTAQKNCNQSLIRIDSSLSTGILNSMEIAGSLSSQMLKWPSNSVSRTSNSLTEPEIDCSSLSESDAIRCDKLDSCFGKSFNSDFELSLFIQTIENDVRHPNKIKERLRIRKEGYLDKFRKVIERAKADLSFLDYEQRLRVVRGLSGVMTKKNISYGVFTIYAQLENRSQCYIFPDKFIKSVQARSSFISFVDRSEYYLVQDFDIFIQPYRIIIV